MSADAPVPAITRYDIEQLRDSIAATDFRRAATDARLLNVVVDLAISALSHPAALERARAEGYEAGQKATRSEWSAADTRAGGTGIPWVTGQTGGMWMVERARADERERCAMIVSDRIMAARLGDLDADLRSIAGSIDHDIRALGPWMPTHQHENGTLAREVVRAQFGVGANSIPVVILDDVFHRPFVVAAEKVERDFRPLTEAEARAAVEGRS